MNYTQLSEGLRSVLKTRNITYKDIASHLKMSESGVKKMLTADDIAYNKLESILNYLDLTLEELEPLAGKQYAQLTVDQEKFFEKHPQHFNFFIQLHHFRMSPENIKKNNNKLSKTALKRYIEDLKQIGILEERDGKVTSLLSEGFNASDKFNTRFRNNYDSCIKALNKIENGKWRSWMYEGFGTFSLSQKSALELRNAIHDLMEEFSTRSEREKKLYNSKDLVNTGTLLLNIPLKIQDIFPII